MSPFHFLSLLLSAASPCLLNFHLFFRPFSPFLLYWHYHISRSVFGFYLSFLPILYLLFRY
ncbi:hypothetical protein EV426DRAFT_616566 [Tirmania nivea]|nr:hypothetical protein EV426DRAFT_616566 [Tirmania nivea]